MILAHGRPSFSAEAGTSLLSEPKTIRVQHKQQDQLWRLFSVTKTSICLIILFFWFYTWHCILFERDSLMATSSWCWKCIICIQYLLSVTLNYLLHYMYKTSVTLVLVKAGFVGKDNAIGFDLSMSFHDDPQDHRSCNSSLGLAFCFPWLMELCPWSPSLTSHIFEVGVCCFALTMNRRWLIHWIW